MSIQLSEALAFFVVVFGELTILFILISFLVSVINHKLPAGRIKQLLSGNRGYGIAVALGAVTPFCSCSTLPMTVGLIQARAAFGPVMTFLFTSPLLNPFIVALFWVSFGAKITVIYTLFVVVLAILSGFLLQHFKFDRYIRDDILQSQPCRKASSESSCESAKEVAPLWERDSLKRLLRDAVKQFISFAPYMVLGVAIGAVVHGYVPESLFAELSARGAWWLIPLAAVVGVFLYVRASTMVPVAASLAAKGMSMGAIMSLTIGGAGASLPEMIMMKKMFHWPLVFAFIGLVFTTACVTGFTIEWL